jgi:hypothetical protein
MFVLIRNREGNLKKAMSLLGSGNTSAAEKYFQKAVDITPLLASRLIEARFLLLSLRFCL